MNIIIKSEKELIDRIDKSNTLLLVRAINDEELKQLINEGVNKFKFNYGANFETFYGHMVKKAAFERTGTIIVYDTNNNNSFDKNFNNKFRIIPTTGAYKCILDLGWSKKSVIEKAIV